MVSDVSLPDVPSHPGSKGGGLTWGGIWSVKWLISWGQASPLPPTPELPAAPADESPAFRSVS